MVLEDTLTLADLLVASWCDSASAFARFEHQRFLWTARVVRESRALWPIYHSPGAHAEVRNQTSNCRNAPPKTTTAAWIGCGTLPRKQVKLCRFNEDRLGLVEGDQILDVSAALDVLPPVRWPVPLGDPLVRHLDLLVPAIQRAREAATRHAVADVRLHSPISSPSKVMAAPANYRLHVEQDTRDAGVDQGVHRKALEGVERPTEKYGLFLKATSAIAGAAEGVQVIFPERRTDHEVELAVVIGKPGHAIARKDAMDHVAGYMIGLDMTVRGTEDRSFRKSADSYTVLGPWFVTSNEISDPHALIMSLWVDGDRRQHSSTGAMTVDIPDLIAIASSMYTLHPGDIILTGTPEGVGPVVAGNRVRVACEGIGEMSFAVSNHT